jgi:3-deoxy-D-manno-octulosonic-acid transferase
VPYLLNVVYLLVLLVALPWLVYQALRKGKYREGYAAKLLGLVPRRTSSKKCLWFHAVSVGEVNLLDPLLRRIAAEQPHWECVLSTTTMTGMALARKKYPPLVSFYCPLDFTWATTPAMRRVRPDALVLVELELWPNLIWAARQQGARTAVINGRLSPRSFRGYRWIKPLVSRLLRQIDLIAVQDEGYAERFRALGARPETVHVTGSLKYDGAETNRENSTTRELAKLAGFQPQDVIFLAGSTQEPEEEMALEVFRLLSAQWPRLKLVLVPRHPERFAEVARMLDRSGLPWQRRSALGNVPAAARSVGAVPADGPPRILLVDAMGELAAWWGTARIAFVGGSLGGRGGQNMIEPAAYGAAVSFGPNTWNFQDIVTAMLERRAAVVVHDVNEMCGFVQRCLAEPSYAADLGQRAQALVRSQQGAAEQTLRLLLRLLGERPPEK